MEDPSHRISAAVTIGLYKSGCEEWLETKAKGRDNEQAGAEFVCWSRL
jgi:hypothetical protein